MPETPFTPEHFIRWTSQLELDDGGLLQLEEFQCRFVADLFSGVREAWLVVPEANGKTTLIAALALYHARFREQAYVPIAASAQEQSLILFRQAEGFVRRTDALFDEFDLRPGIREIRCRATGGLIKAKAADERTGDGIIPTLAICDELHRHKDLGLYNTWTGKLVKRHGAQVVVISTAGEPGSEFEMAREQMRQAHTPVEQREGFTRIVTDRFAMHDYFVPDGADVDDIHEVKRANPFSRITLSTLREKRQSPSMTLAHWRRFTCNLPTRSITAAISEREWADAGGEVIPEGEPVWAGLDCGWRFDTTAIVPLWMPETERRVLGPANVVVPPRDGSSTELAAVESAILSVHERNPIHTLVMDMSDARDVSAWAEAELDCRVVERSSAVTSQVQDFAAFTEALRNGWLHHCDDPALTRHVLNATIRLLPRGDAVFARPAEARRAQNADLRVIDALVAAAMVHSVAVTNSVGSVYDQRGLVVV